MSGKRFTSVERAGLLLLAAAIIIAAVVMALSRNPLSYEEEPAVPVAVDSLIEETCDSGRDTASATPRKRNSAPTRNHLDDPF